MSEKRIMDSASPVEGVPVEDEKAGARVAASDEIVRRFDNDSEGYLDDTFIKGGIESIHIEQLADEHLWWAVYLTNGARFAFNAYSRLDGSLYYACTEKPEHDVIATREAEAQSTTHDASGEAHAKPSKPEPIPDPQRTGPHD